MISLAKSQLGPSEAHLEDEVLLNHAVLVKRIGTDGNSDQILRLEALSCLEYMSQRWGPLGERILREVSMLQSEFHGGISRIPETPPSRLSSTRLHD